MLQHISISSIFRAVPRHRRLIASVACLAVFTVTQAKEFTVAQAEESGLRPTPQQGVLLLRSGEAIQGKITRAGDLYYVVLPNGEIRVQAADVELSCPDLEEGYRYKRAAIRVGSVYDHLRLAQWCLRHDLLGPAARELADAFDAEPNHPMIGVLERRLKVAMQQPSTKGQGADAIEKRAGDNGAGGRGDSAFDDRSSSSRLPRDQYPSPKDLDLLIRGMPPGSVETFTQTIQPLLINNCTVAGCHGPGSETDFRLLRIPVNKPPSRMLTQRNLHATLQWIDHRQPASSQLLSEPIRPHGTAEKPVFNNAQSDQYRRLVDWVNQLAETPAPKIPATVAPPTKPPVHAMAAGVPPDLHLPSPEALSLENRQPAPTLPTPQYSGTGVSPVKRGAPLPGFVPVDPFDPEIFNRRFFPKKSSGGAGG